MDMLGLLVTWCMVKESGTVLYRELVQLLNWKTTPPEEVVTRITQLNSGQLLQVIKDHTP